MLKPIKSTLTFAIGMMVLSSPVSALANDVTPQVTDVYAFKTAPVTPVINVEIDFHLDKTVSGAIGSNEAPPFPIFDAVVSVLQCNGLGQNCAVISANSGNDEAAVGTSKKPLSFGHTYKACGSATDTFNDRGVNICTPLMAYSG